MRVLRRPAVDVDVIEPADYVTVERKTHAVYIGTYNLQFKTNINHSVSHTIILLLLLLVVPCRGQSPASVEALHPHRAL